MPRLDNNVLANRIARYGLPLLVLIFYLHSARFLEFTPDHGFIVPTYATGLIDGVGLEGPSWDTRLGTPSPLWTLLVAAGGAFGVDLLLTAKIFGLFFGSLSVLVTYLLTVEVFDDRILALCAALLVATGPWLMMASVAGDGITLALALSLAGLFFHLRGDFLVGVLMTALAGLVLWPALILSALCVLDDLRRASTPSERRRRGTTGGLLLVSVPALWALLAWRLGAGLVPFPTGALLGLDPLSTTSLAVFGVSGIVVASSAVFRARIAFGRRSVLPLALLWSLIAILAGFTTQTNAVFLAYPFLIMAGYLGLVLLFPPLSSDGRLRLGPIFAVTAVLLLSNQAGLHLFARPTMLAGAVELAQLESAASWVRASSSTQTVVASDRPWTVSYIAGGLVSPWAENSQVKPDVVVLSHGELPGYLRAYRAPIDMGPAGVQLYGQVSVWTKSGE